MPNIVDFDTIKDIKTLLVQPKGWTKPLYIEYGVGLHYSVTPSYYWRVKGTTHTFIIPISRFHYVTAGKYEKHFEEALEGFRTEYLEWEKENFQGAEWQEDYRKEYSKFISEAIPE